MPLSVGDPGPNHNTSSWGTALAPLLRGPPLHNLGALGTQGPIPALYLHLVGFLAESP